MPRAQSECGANYRSLSSGRSPEWERSAFLPARVSQIRKSMAKVANRRAPSDVAVPPTLQNAKEIPQTVRHPWPAPRERKFPQTNRGSAARSPALSRASPAQMHPHRKYLCRCTNPLGKDPDKYPKRPTCKDRSRPAPKKFFEKMILRDRSAGKE